MMFYMHCGLDLRLGTRVSSFPFGRNFVGLGAWPTRVQVVHLSDPSPALLLYVVPGTTESLHHTLAMI